jgi:hypothetical protein
MKITSIFTDEELALIDSGKYTPGRAVLDTKLDLAAALEREACAKLLEESSGTGKLVSCMSAAAAIRARGQA